MGRQRLPSAPSSRYITPEGAARLRAELEHLWRVERPRVTQAVSDAAAMGDRSENAEYIYGKKRLREIDRRVRYLQKRIAEMKVVDRAPEDRSRIYFGAWIKLEDDDGDVHTYRIVGADEFDTGAGFISIDSPLARGLLGKAAGDEVTLMLPKGESVFAVLAVQYHPFD